MSPVPDTRWLVRYPLLCGIFLIAAVTVLFIAPGCSSSESTQAQTSAVTTSPASDTSAAPPPATTAKSSRGLKTSSSGKQQGFVTQEDTIEAQFVTRSRSTARPKAPSKRAEKKKYYSVQIGAFRILGNADHAQKLAKQRYKKPVYHFFDKAIKMYRVTVGNLSTLKAGLAFLKTVQHEHPKEYKDAWVAEMRR